MSAPPPTAPEPSRRSRLVLALAVMVATLALDLWSKSWAWENLRHQKPVMIIDPLLEFSFSFNLGAAFGFLNSVSWSRLFFIVVTLLALVYMAWLAMSLPTRRSYGFVSVGLIAAGASGNLHDRLMRTNEAGDYGVVDFIKINYPWGGSWPTFNVADVLLLLGVATLLLYLRREGDDVGSPEEASKKEAERVEAESEVESESEVEAEARPETTSEAAAGSAVAD